MKTFTADEWTERHAMPLHRMKEFTASYVAQLNALLRTKSSIEIIQWVCTHFSDSIALSSSFGIQSAVMLHMVTRVKSNVPVVWIDTGYLPAETYQFASVLKERLELNLHVYQSAMSPAFMEATHGRLWEHPSAEAHQLYGYLRKVEPMERALNELGMKALLVGLRAEQTEHRQGLDIVHIHKGRLKICPILNWTQEDVNLYMEQYRLPFHPLKEFGYATVGDYHSSRPVTESDTDIRATRFHGKSQECGLHIEELGNNQNDEEEPVMNLEDVDVVVYSKPTCKYCVLAKEAITRRKWSYKEFIVGEDIDYPSLCRLVGEPVQSVPQIFLRGQYIGGYAELSAAIESKS